MPGSQAGGKWSSTGVRTQGGPLTLSAKGQEEDLCGGEAPESCEDMQSAALAWHRGLNPQHPPPWVSGLNSYFTPSSVC